MEQQNSTLTPRAKIGGLAVGVYVISEVATSLFFYYFFPTFSNTVHFVISGALALAYWVYRTNNPSPIKRDAYIIVPLVVLIYGSIIAFGLM